MLPDFAGMAGIRLPKAVASGALADGIAFHHESDRVFHRLRRFREQESWTLTHMLERGLRRGPARGIAHVGVELSIDGALVTSNDSHALYLGAVNAARTLDLPWESAESEVRFRKLASRLFEFGIPKGYADPQVVADRLVRIMQPRPLLRLTEDEAPILHDAMPSVHLRVGEETAAIMMDMRAQLPLG
tara:strand:- start:16142 stop:16705 length:564 start_codon:yes stop_codon:yes gene_type:complete